MMALQLSQEQASVLLPVLTQLWTSQLLKGALGTSHESNWGEPERTPHYRDCITRRVCMSVCLRTYVRPCTENFN